VAKLGRFGRFLACTGFPDCKNTKPILKLTGVSCPKCQEGELAERMTRRKRKFWGCSLYPKCDFATWDDPVKKAPIYDPDVEQAKKEAIEKAKVAAGESAKPKPEKRTARKKKV
jgi:DNA topoisomerase I